MVAVLLQGCVAAAIPVIASGAMAARGKKAAAQGEAILPVAAEPERQVALPDTELASASAPAPAASLAEPEGAPVSLANVSASQPLIDMARQSGFAPFIEYAFAHAGGSRDGETSQSAMLRSPAALDGQRSGCDEKPRAVLIDLDPEGEDFAPATSIASDPHFAEMLANLRANGIAIAWISGLSAIEAGAVRTVLSTSGLDTEGADTLLLMRYGDDRKQSRRNEFAAEHCVIAIAGDARGDFDELYEYIIDPAAAAPLEALYGDGWFITPPALTPGQ